ESVLLLRLWVPSAKWAQRQLCSRWIILTSPAPWLPISSSRLLWTMPRAHWCATATPSVCSSFDPKLLGEHHMSTYLYGANVHANGIRQHYLRYGGAEGERAGLDADIIIPGITSPAITWGFVGERFGQHFDTYVLDDRGRGL